MTFHRIRAFSSSVVRTTARDFNLIHPGQAPLPRDTNGTNLLAICRDNNNNSVHSEVCIQKDGRKNIRSGMICERTALQDEMKRQLQPLLRCSDDFILTQTRDLLCGVPKLGQYLRGRNQFLLELQRFLKNYYLRSML
jgi:hypothetical protein